MFLCDNVFQVLGMKILEVVFGCVCMSMLVCSDMFNGYVICYGGFIFVLVDSSFVFVCNSCNFNIVVLGCSIEYVVLVLCNDVLIVEVQECMLVGCIGVYDIIVSNQDGKIIVLFWGKFYCIKGEVIIGLLVV